MNKLKNSIKQFLRNILNRVWKTYGIPRVNELLYPLAMQLENEKNRLSNLENNEIALRKQIDILQEQLSRTSDLNARMKEMVLLTKDNGLPNINPVWEIARHQKLMRLNIKNFGFELARSLQPLIPPSPLIAPVCIGLGSKPSTQSDIESPWVGYWCSRLHIPVIYHRKIWELAYVTQALYEHGMLQTGKRGLGFGCGQEPLPSLFASYDVEVTVTDLDPVQAAGLGWAETGQHAGVLEQTYYPELVDEARYAQNVSLRYLDMNCIPSELDEQYDFCWSICALEHLGSIQKGLDFIRNSLNVLKPGGIAVHTTEFNFQNDDETVDNWMTVLFQRRHFETIACILQEEGHTVMPLDFDVGNAPMDAYIDMPPYLHDTARYDHTASSLQNLKNHAFSEPPHLKVALDGFAVTCFGLIIRKKMA